METIFGNYVVNYWIKLENVFIVFAYPNALYLYNPFNIVITSKYLTYDIINISNV